MNPSIQTLKQLVTFLLVIIAMGAFVPAYGAPTVIDLDSANASVGVPTYRASGFQSAISTSQPESSLIAPLKPYVYRGSFGSVTWNNTGTFYSYDSNGNYREGGAYARLKDYGTRFQICLSGDWFYEFYIQNPYDNWTAWSDFLRAKVTWTYNHTNLSGQHDLRDVQWDIWNEPNYYGVFWQGSLEQFREAWLRAYKAIRSVDPNAIIVGPSIAGYDSAYLKDFLLWAKQTKWDAAQTLNVVPTILSWHDWNDTKIADDIGEMKKFLSDNGILGNQINQCHGVTMNEYHYYKYNTTMNPSVLLTNIVKIEEAAHLYCDSNFTYVSGNRTCAEDPDANEGDSCTNFSLGSTLVASTMEKRNIWWVYKAYCEMTGTLQKVTPEATTDNPMYGLASLDTSLHRALVLLGKRGGNTGDVVVQVVNIPDELIQNGQTQVVVDSIPYVPASTAPLAAPIRLFSKKYDVTDRSITFTIPAMMSNCVATIRIIDGSGTVPVGLSDLCIAAMPKRLVTNGSELASLNTVDLKPSRPMPH